MPFHVLITTILDMVNLRFTTKLGGEGNVPVTWHIQYNGGYFGYSSG